MFSTPAATCAFVSSVLYTSGLQQGSALSVGILSGMLSRLLVLRLQIIFYMQLVSIHSDNKYHTLVQLQFLLALLGAVHVFMPT